MRQRNSMSKRLLWLLAAFLAGYIIANIFDFHSLAAWLEKRFSSTGPKETMAKKTLDEPMLKPKFEFYTLLAKDNSVPSANRKLEEKKPEVAEDKPTQEADMDAAIKAEATSMEKLKNELETVAKKAPEALPKTIDPLKTEKNTSRLNASGVQAQTLTRPHQTPATAAPKPAPRVAIKTETYLIQVAAFNKHADAERLKASLMLIGFDATISTVSRQSVLWYRVTIGPFSSKDAAEKAQAVVLRDEHMKGIIRRTA